MTNNLEYILNLKPVQLMNFFQDKNNILQKKDISILLKNKQYKVILYFIHYGNIPNIIENRDLILNTLAKTKPFNQDDFIGIFTKLKERGCITEENIKLIKELINNLKIISINFIYNYT